MIWLHFLGFLRDGSVSLVKSTITISCPKKQKRSQTGGRGSLLNLAKVREIDQWAWI